MGESAETAVAVDLLTAQLTGENHFQLLERDAVEKLYQELALSVAGRDSLKLGRQLGADGVVVLRTVRQGNVTNLDACLLAVKPGVVLLDRSIALPQGKELLAWAQGLSGLLEPWGAKLRVLARDAIPVSVVNLRMATPSANADELEHSLKCLLIQRLANEPTFFVLERQRLQMLGEEKELNKEEEAFWNGSYLLDGSANTEALSRDTLSLLVRIRPPGQAAPLTVQAQGSRTNLPALVNQIGTAIVQALQIHSSAPAWNPALEAEQFFQEAQWARRWGAWKEAQEASDAAWTLGKTDEACATLRVQAGLGDVLEGFDGYNIPSTYYIDAQAVSQYLESFQKEHPLGFHTQLLFDDTGHPRLTMQALEGLPQPEYIARADRLLALYRQLGETLPREHLKLDSDWHRLGTTVLNCASEVLQAFNSAAASQPQAREPLVDLRAHIRQLADWMSQAPGVRTTYFDQTPLEDWHNQAWIISRHSENLYSCMLTWGCYWQETPEQTLALYRELMRSPNFTFIHGALWKRRINQPRHVALDQAGQARVPLLWSNFVKDLDVSTNLLLRLEAKALVMTDATRPAERDALRQQLLSLIQSNRTELVAHPADLFQDNWGLDSAAQLWDLHQDFESKTLPALQFVSLFEKQKLVLSQHQLLDFFELCTVFDNIKIRGCTPAQAGVLKPLLIAYRTNLLAQLQNCDAGKARKIQFSLRYIQSYENRVEEVIHPQPPRSPVVLAQVRNPAQALVSPAASNAPARQIEVTCSLELPKTGIGLAQLPFFRISAHHWQEGRLVLNIDYSGHTNPLPPRFQWASGSPGSAILLLDPESRRWDVVDCGLQTNNTSSLNPGYNRCALFENRLYLNDHKTTRRFDLAQRSWKTNSLLQPDDYEFYPVQQHLLAVSQNAIYELLDGGGSVRVIASLRRNPPECALDGLGFWGRVAFLNFPGQPWSACVGTNLFVRADKDWVRQGGLPSFHMPASVLPEIFDGGALFYGEAYAGLHGAGLWGLSATSPCPQLWLEESLPQSPARANNPLRRPPLPARSTPRWELPQNITLFNTARALHHLTLYLLVDHSSVQNILDAQHSLERQVVSAPQGYHSELLAFSEGASAPHRFRLHFAEGQTCPPVASLLPGSVLWPQPGTWMLVAKDTMYLGLETPHASGRGSAQPGMGYKPALWSIPLAELESSQ